MGSVLPRFRYLTISVHTLANLLYYEAKQSKTKHILLFCLLSLSIVACNKDFVEENDEPVLNQQEECKAIPLEDALSTLEDFFTETKSGNMLKNNKPVFISAIPGSKWSSAHSWVVDGAKYSGLDYLLHFNFGWEGNCNGYFSTDCLCPASAVQYDNNYTQQALDEISNNYNYTYSWHFRVITYDVPSAVYVSRIWGHNINDLIA